MSIKHPRRCQPSSQILSSLELDLLAVKARASDVEGVLFVEEEGNRLKRPTSYPEGIVPALFPGERTLDSGGIVAILISAAKRLLGGRELLSRRQRETLLRDPWYARPEDFPPDHWSESTRELRQTIFEGRFRLSANDFLTKRATEILEVVNDLVAMHYVPGAPRVTARAPRPEASVPELGENAA